MYSTMTAAEEAKKLLREARQMELAQQRKIREAGRLQAKAAKLAARESERQKIGLIDTEKKKAARERAAKEKAKRAEWIKGIWSKDRLNRADFVVLLAEELGVTDDEAKKIVMKTFGLVTKVVHAEKSLSMTGFGSFNHASYPERTARNPQTGETVKVPKRNAVKFAPGTLFTQYLNGRPLPKDGNIIAKAAKGSGDTISDYVKTNRSKGRYVKPRTKKEN